jgi:hypothetical protein
MVFGQLKIWPFLLADPDTLERGFGGVVSVKFEMPPWINRIKNARMPVCLERCRARKREESAEISESEKILQQSLKARRFCSNL